MAITWNQNTKDTNLSTGYFNNPNNIKQTLGSFTTSILKLIKPGSSVKFLAPEGKHFDQEGNLVTGEANYIGAITYKWVKTVKNYYSKNFLE